MDYQSFSTGSLPSPVTAGSAVNGLLANSVTFLGLGSMLKSVFPSLAGKFSASQISNTIKLFLLGSTVELGRRSWEWIYTRFRPKLYISATFLDGDPVHEWIMIFLAEKRVWYHARDYTIQYKSSTQQWGVTVIRPGEGQTQADAEGVEELEETVSFLPNYDTPQLFRWRGYWVEVIREAPKPQGLPHEIKVSQGSGTLRLNLYTLNQGALRDLIQEAKKYYIEESKQQVIVRSLGINQGMVHGIFRASGSKQFWTDIKKKPYRPLDSVILPKGVLDSIVKDAREFITSEHWYTRAGIPYRRGYLFHGPPGTGKSSTVYALAGALGLELYTLSLSTSGLTDATLQMAADGIPKRGILLIEDIDCAFPSRDDEEEEMRQAQTKATSSRVAENMMMGIPPPPGRSSVTMSGLLNVLDGVNSESGKIFMATTNYVDRLDDALLRPGRIDMKVEYKLASRDQAAAIFNRFFAVPEDAQGSSEKMPYEGSVHHPLADEFASRFPDDEFTVAELQGYLLTCRTFPRAALDGISAWVAREREARLAKAERERERKAKAKEAKQGETSAQMGTVPPMFQGLFGMQPLPASGSAIASAQPPPPRDQSGLEGDQNLGSDRVISAPPLDVPTPELKVPEL
ncbi:hypothetical protein EYR40_002866 [Pleurotus pulmonarius]|nr:hypothetical protein EYR40_002866 [Pleurotus pulmonarius]